MQIQNLQQAVAELRRQTACEIWKALPIVDAESFAFAKDNYKGLTLLVDSEKGGRPCDRVLSGELSRIRPTILAGGLTPENVGGAIALGEPIGVDVAGGVESDNDPRKKDIDKIKAFIKEARKNL